MRQMAQVNFKYRENGDPCDFCTTASGMLFSYEPAKLLAGSSLTKEYNPKITSAFLERFVPENCLVTVTAQEFDEDSSDVDVDSHLSSASSGEWITEKWYGAKHRSVKIPDNLLTEWSNPSEIDSRLALPKLNEFIPSDFSLRCDQEPISDDSPKPTADVAIDPPAVLVERPGLRLFHKMDRTFRVPRTHIRAELTSPNPYSSPRQMTLNRLYAKVLRDDLSEYVYDASIAGCSYRVTCVPLGFRVSLSGYSEKLPHLVEVVTSRMLSLIDEMKQGPDAQSRLAQKFEKARQSLLRQTKNFRMESPYETCSYISRMTVEDRFWHVNQYVEEMEDPMNPLTMVECARAAEESLLGRGRAEALCMGNINGSEAKQIADIIAERFRSKSRPVNDDEIPLFKSLKIPTKQEAMKIYGPEVADLATPTKIEQVVYSAEEENNAITLMLQAGSEHELGYEGIAAQELLSYVAYNSAYDTLRTKEQLGYIVSAFVKKTAGGGNAFAVLVQSSSTLPAALEERCEAWLTQFRQELEEMPEERITMEASAVVAQLLERDQKLGDEVSSAWGEILATEGLPKNSRQPKFDRLQTLAKYLTVGGKDGNGKDVTAASLKANMISFFDKYLDANSPERRAMCARVYCQKAKAQFDENVGKPGVLSNYDDSRHVKQFLSAYPTAPYWV
jgi:insulysin